MASNLKGYIRALKEFRATPDEEFFDTIYDQIKKPKKKRRILFWIFPISLIGIITYITISQPSNLNHSNQEIKPTIKQVASEASDHKLQVEQNLSLGTPQDKNQNNSIDLESDSKNNYSNSNNQTLTKNNVLKIETAKNDGVHNLDISSEIGINKTKTISLAESQLNISDHSKSKAQTLLFEDEKKMTNIRRTQGESLTKSKVLNNNKALDFNTSIKHQKPDNIEVNTEGVKEFTKNLKPKSNNVFETEKTKIPTSKSNPKAISQLLKVILLQTLKPQELSKRNADIITIKTIDKPIRSQFRNQSSIRLEAEGSQAQFCKNGVASSKGSSAQLTLPVGKKINLNIGVAHQDLNYNFLFDNDMLLAYGSTDKYPGMFFLRDRILSINNNLKYQSLSVGLNYNLFSISKINFEVGLSQSLIINAKQIIGYALDEGQTYRYKKSTNPFSLGQSRINLRLFYKLSKSIDIYTLGSYGYSFQFIGIEKEKYSGLSIGLGLNIRI